MGVKRYVVHEPPNHLMVVYEGVFHLKTVYRSAYEWIQERGWRSYENDNKFETLYAEERATADKKLWMWWRLQKASLTPAPDNAYFHYFMNVNFLLVYLVDVEVVKDGKKIKCQRAEIDIQIKPWIELDYQDKWAKHPILKNFNRLFVERIWKNDIEKKEDRLLGEAYQFQGMLKKMFELQAIEAPGEVKELYAPPRGFSPKA